MCLRHWRLVPKDIQDRVWKHYRPGQCNLDPPPTALWHKAADDAGVAVVKVSET